MALLIHASVQTDLRLSTAQLTKIDALSAELAKQRRSLPDLRELEPESQQSRLKEWVDANERAVAEILTVAQRKRLEQIAMQVQSLYALSDPKLVGLLQLTGDQKDRVAACQAEADDAIWKWVCSGGDHKPGPTPGEIRKGYLARMLDTLTPEQRDQWGQLVGEPFHGEIFLGERGISARR
jgi:hypothetical protein